MKKLPEMSLAAGATCFNVWGVFPQSKVAAVIPCHNESATIGSIVQQTKQFVPHVIVIDDGSTDNTRACATAAGAEVIRVESAKGKGAALHLAWTRASERGFQLALCLDGDGQHSPSDIPRFLAAAADAPLVIGNRMGQKERIPFVRRFVNRWMSRRLSRVAGRDLPDTQCGFRLMDLTIWSQLDLRTTHFEVESEVLLAFVAAGQRVEFVPISVIYKSERSKISPVRDTIRWFRWLWNVSKERSHQSQRTAGIKKSVVSKTTSLAENV